jgi:hypothetical protein
MNTLINKQKIKLNVPKISKRKNKKKFKIISYTKINLNNYMKFNGIKQYLNRGYKLNFEVSINYKGKKNRYINIEKIKKKEKENINKVKNIDFYKIKKYIKDNIY